MNSVSGVNQTVNYLLILAGILAVLLGFAMGENAQAEALYVDQLAVMFGSVLLGSGIAGLQMVDSMRKGQYAQLESVKRTMLDHVASSDLDRDIPDNSEFRNKLYLYHQTSEDHSGNGTVWKVVPYDFSNTAAKRRLQSESPQITVEPGQPPLQYTAELLLKSKKIVVFVTNKNEGDGEPTGVFVFDEKVGGTYSGFILHMDMGNYRRISKAILSGVKLDGHTGDLHSNDLELDQRKLNERWTKGFKNIEYGFYID
jgi:hypothetical protein